jgi:hypothetical protein
MKDKYKQLWMIADKIYDRNPDLLLGILDKMNLTFDEECTFDKYIAETLHDFHNLRIGCSEAQRLADSFRRDHSIATFSSDSFIYSGADFDEFLKDYIQTNDNENNDEDNDKDEDDDSDND